MDPDRGGFGSDGSLDPVGRGCGLVHIRSYIVEVDSVIVFWLVFLTLVLFGAHTWHASTLGWSLEWSLIYGGILTATSWIAIGALAGGMLLYDKWRNK